MKARWAIKLNELYIEKNGVKRLIGDLMHNYKPFHFYNIVKECIFDLEYETYKF